MIASTMRGWAPSDSIIPVAASIKLSDGPNNGIPVLAGMTGKRPVNFVNRRSRLYALSGRIAGKQVPELLGQGLGQGPFGGGHVNGMPAQGLVKG